MVGNRSWNFPDREVFDKSAKYKKIFAWRPYKTNKGWRWLCFINRVSTIEWVEDKSFFNKTLRFFGFPDLSMDQEIIRYEVLK